MGREPTALSRTNMKATDSVTLTLTVDQINLITISLGTRWLANRETALAYLDSGDFDVVRHYQVENDEVDAVTTHLSRAIHAADTYAADEYDSQALPAFRATYNAAI